MIAYMQEYGSATSRSVSPVLFILDLAVIIITHNVINGYNGMAVEYCPDGNLFNLNRLQAHIIITLTGMTM